MPGVVGCCLDGGVGGLRVGVGLRAGVIVGVLVRPHVAANAPTSLTVEGGAQIHERRAFGSATRRNVSDDVVVADQDVTGLKLGCSVETQRHLLIRALACTVNPSSDDLEQQVNFAPVSVPRNLVA